MQHLRSSSVLFFLILMLLASCSPKGEQSETTGQQPNILFIPVDDLRPELGAYGNTYVKTPNMDRLAEQGVTFTRTYCQQAVCNP